MTVCTRCATQLPSTLQVCTGCGLVLSAANGGAAPLPAPPMVAAPVMPPPEPPAHAVMPELPSTPKFTAPARYGIPQPIERPANPVMPKNPFAKGAQTDRGLPPQLPVRHESASIPVAFAQFSEPAHAPADNDHAEVVVLRPSLAEALEAVIADLPEDAPEKAPEPFPEVLSIAPPAKVAPGWS